MMSMVPHGGHRTPRSTAIGSGTPRCLITTRSRIAGWASAIRAAFVVTLGTNKRAFPAS